MRLCCMHILLDYVHKIFSYLHMSFHSICKSVGFSILAHVNTLNKLYSLSTAVHDRRTCIPWLLLLCKPNVLGDTPISILIDMPLASDECSLLLQIESVCLG